MMTLRGPFAAVGTAVAAAVLAPGAVARAADLLTPPPTATAESAVLDLVAVLGSTVVGYLAIVSTVLVVLEQVAPRSRALVLAARLTPARWRRIVLATAGATVALTAAVPTAAVPTGIGPQDDVRPPPLHGLRLPDRPESLDVAPSAGRPVPTVVVRRGDSLWRIAERSLPPSAGNADVVRAVRRWHRGNRVVIGADPDLIRPGTTLVPPPQEARP